MMAEVQRIRNEHTVTGLNDIAEPLDLRNVLGQHARLVDGTSLGSDLADHAASSQDQIQDWSDIIDDISHVEQLGACRNILASVREIEEHGYKARWGRGKHNGR